MIRENFTGNLNEPPEYGEIILSFSLEPVSLQSSSEKRNFVKAEIRKKTRFIKYLLSGDVKVEIQWLLHEQQRYESADSPDMDNIIKPILDGLSGPEGILIDDCQVQTVGSHWIDWTKQEHQINIYIRYISDDYVKKNGLIFINMGNNLYMPFNSNTPPFANKIILEQLEKMSSLKAQIHEKTGDYYQAKMFSSIQRTFHKSRIFEEFTTIELENFKNELNTKNN
jgi:Holliday junction resolvase RusA-like endonuclease